MSLSLAAAGGTALALYAWRRRGGGGGDVCGTSEHPPVDRHFATAHRAPNSFMEDMYFFTEGMRYMWGDILSRWRTVDLLIGLAYLCRKDPEEHPLADIARQGRLFGADLAPEQWPAALAELGELERFFRYCSGLRERRPAPQRQYFRDVLGIADEDLLVQELRAGVLKPSHVLIRDHQLGAIVLAVRGTHSFKDMFTSLTGASKPHHLVDANGVVLGYSHFGMLAAARWIKGQTRARLEQTLAESPGYRLVIVGHSLGAGAAALLTMMLREVGGLFAEARCVAVACPSCMTLELAESCDAYVTSVMHGCDCIPTICPATADALREEMTRSSWWQEFRADVRASGLVRAVESGLRGVGSATSWTTSKLAACYQQSPSFTAAAGSRRRPALKRRNSDDNLAAGGAAEEALPLSSSAPAGNGLGLAEAALAAREAGGGSGEGGVAAAAVRHVRWGATRVAGQGAAVLSSAASSTSTVLRSTSGLLRRMWRSGGACAAVGSSAEAAGGEDAFEDAADDGSPFSSAAGTATGAPTAMDIDGEEEDAVPEGAACEDAAMGAPERCSSSQRRRVQAELQLDSAGSLEEEAHLRMHEVEQAVHDAEAEEAELGRDDSTVPAVIRPGSYGSSSAAGGTPSKQDPHWRRQLYPAGRIMHLVPARLVPGTAAFAAAAAAANSTATDAQQSPVAGPGGSEPAARAPAGLAGSSLGGGSQRRGRHAAKLSVSDLMAGEGLLGRVASEGGNGTATATQDAQQRPAGTSQPSEDECMQQDGQQAAQQQQQQQQQPKARPSGKPAAALEECDVFAKMGGVKRPPSATGLPTSPRGSGSTAGGGAPAGGAPKQGPAAAGGAPDAAQAPQQGSTKPAAEGKSQAAAPPAAAAASAQAAAPTAAGGRAATLPAVAPPAAERAPAAANGSREAGRPPAAAAAGAGDAPAARSKPAGSPRKRKLAEESGSSSGAGEGPPPSAAAGATAAGSSGGQGPSGPDAAAGQQPPAKRQHAAPAAGAAAGTSGSGKDKPGAAAAPAPMQVD